MTTPLISPSATLYSTLLESEAVDPCFCDLGRLSSSVSMFHLMDIVWETLLTFSGTFRAEKAKVDSFTQPSSDSGFTKQSSMHLANLFAAETLAPSGILLTTLTLLLQFASSSMHWYKLSDSVPSVVGPLIVIGVLGE